MTARCSSDIFVFHDFVGLAQHSPAEYMRFEHLFLLFKLYNLVHSGCLFLFSYLFCRVLYMRFEHAFKKNIYATL